jgi:nucleoside phosphorylase
MASRPDNYTVAWVCALPLEMAVASAMLDGEPHPGILPQASDQNVYTLGNISGHNVVIACLPSGVYGLTSAATVLADMRQTFPALRFGLMVGIGGGVPSQSVGIRLGDVVVSIPTPTSSGVVQYDYGKAMGDGQFEITGQLNKPPSVLLAAVSKIRSQSMTGDVHFSPIISNTFWRHPTLTGECHRPGNDWLFCADYNHETPAGEPDCSLCDQSKTVHRKSRDTDEPRVHYGLIASGNQVMKDATKRDKLATELGVYCFEMEAAGLMDQLPCLVIRGICDYCDSHKNKQWQGYAALAAAVYAKLLLGIVPSHGDGKAGRRCMLFRTFSEGPHLILTTDALATEFTSEGKACMQSLFVGNPSDDKNALKRRKGTRAPGTCEWILETDMLQGWLDQTSADQYENSTIFWLYGYPGTGKSTMAITIIEELPKHSSFLDGERTLVYFLCDSGSEDRRTATSLLRSVIYQLVMQHLGLIHYVLPKYELLKERLLGSFDTLWSILMEIGRDKASGKKYVIIDALDECDQDSQVTFLTQLAQTAQAELATQGGLGIFFLITSRPYLEIRQLIGDARCLDLSSDRNVRGDLQAVIAEKVKVMGGRNKYPPAVMDKVLRILEEKAGGTFLWVGIVCDELSLTRSRDVVKRLEGLPQGLHALYQNLLDSATAHGDDDRQTILHMLSFVVIAQRTFGVAELADACELYCEEDEESRLAFTQEDIEMCRLMLVVQDGYVRLLHTSVRDFLVQSSGFGLMDEPEAHGKLASRCISYLVETRGLGTGGDNRESNSKFFEYAILHWPDHASSAGPHFAVSSDIEEFFDMTSEVWRRWLTLYRRSKPFSMVDGTFSVLHIASRWGILPLARFIVAKAKEEEEEAHDSAIAGKETGWYLDNNFHAENGATPMQEAAERGFVNVLNLLLDNAVTGMTISEHVLYAAANNEQSGKDMMSILLQYPKAQIQLSNRTILAAVRNRKQGPDVLNLLLRRFESQIHISKDLVQSAVYNKMRGSQMINSLLRHGNLQISSSAMDAICASFDTQTVETLLMAIGPKSFQITRDLVFATEDNARWGRAVMSLLLDHPKCCLTEKAFEHMCATSSAQLVNLAVRKQGKSFKITDKLIRATSRNSNFLEIMTPILRQRSESMTAAAVEAIYACCPPTLVKLLPTTMIELTSNSIKAAADNLSGGPDVLMILLGKKKHDIPANLFPLICRSFGEDTLRKILTEHQDGYKVYRRNA